MWEILKLLFTNPLTFLSGPNSKRGLDYRIKRLKRLADKEDEKSK